MCRVRVPSFLVLSIFLVCQTVAVGAQGTGSISLRVATSDGAVPGALVTAVHTSDASVTRTTFANETGIANFLNLKPGCYTVTIKLEGFVTQTKTICVEANGQAAEVAVLQLESIQEEVITQGNTEPVTTAELPLQNIQIIGSVVVSRADVNSRFGIGTVVTGLGELFLLQTDEHIDRVGFDIGTMVASTGPGFVLGPASRGFLTFGGAYAEGSDTTSGSATVGANGVDSVALTFLQRDPGGVTGTFSNVAGDELVGRLEYDNQWAVGHFGYHEVIPLNGPNSTEVFAGGALYYEYFSQDFMAHADIIRGGTSLVGQQTHGSTNDEYYGVKVSGGVTVPFFDGMRMTAEGYVIPSYHRGDADLSQSTNLGAGVSQRLDFSNDGFALSGGASVSLVVDIGQLTSLNLGYEYSVLDKVSELHVPANPNEQPARFDDGTVERHFGRISITTEFSDVRLKRDLIPVGRLDNGLGLYRYRYLWSDTQYVGVMAQEVEGLLPAAVHRGVSGYLRVDYARLGIRLQTWEEWKRAQEQI